MLWLATDPGTLGEVFVKAGGKDDDCARAQRVGAQDAIGSALAVCNAMAGMDKAATKECRDKAKLVFKTAGGALEQFAVAEKAAAVRQVTDRLSACDKSGANLGWIGFEQKHFLRTENPATLRSAITPVYLRCHRDF